MRCSGAAVADMLHDRLLALARTGPPKRKRPGPGQSRASSVEFSSVSKSTIQRSEAASQRAIRHAVRRLRDLEREAELFAAVGLIDAGLRLEALAERIKADVLA